MLLICPVLLPITWNCRIFSLILWSGLSYVRVLTICLLLVYFVSAAGCHCFDFSQMFAEELMQECYLDTLLGETFCSALLDSGCTKTTSLWY